MAIRTDDLQIFESIIFSIAVLMMDMQYLHCVIPAPFALFSSQIEQLDLYILRIECSVSRPADAILYSAPVLVRAGA